MIETGPRGLPTVLVVDDEPAILESLAELLRREFHVLATSDPDEAIATMRERDVAVLLSDQRMPKVTGAELLAQAANVSPETVRVLLTGYSDVEAVVQAVNAGRVFYYLTKPWNPDHILGLLRTAVQTHHLADENRALLRDLATLGKEMAAAALRPDPAEENRDALARDVAFLRAAIDEARSAFQQLQRSQTRVVVCRCCCRIRTPEGGWDELGRYLTASAEGLSATVCPECATEEGLPRPAGPAA